MDFLGRFFQVLLEKGSVLFVPSRVLQAYRLGALETWGLVGGAEYVGSVLGLEVPTFSLHVAEQWEGSPRAPQLPDPDFGLEQWEQIQKYDHLVPYSSYRIPSSTERLLSWEGEVYQVWLADIDFRPCQPPYQRYAYDFPKLLQHYNLIQKRFYAQRLLRLKWEFGLEDHDCSGGIVILQEYFEKNRVQHIRRQVEDKLRKSPAEVVIAARRLKQVERWREKGW